MVQLAADRGTTADEKLGREIEQPENVCGKGIAERGRQLQISGEIGNTYMDITEKH